MKTSWTRGLDAQNAKDVTQFYKESVMLRKRLSVMLQHTIEDKRAGQVLESLYESPNWPYLQADRVGYERAIRDIIDLIK